MTRRLPPLNTLRAFEAAARHASFQAAAEELHVTPSAVSHQIKSLEIFLGVSLFRRLTRRVRLTAEGRSYLPGIAAALDQIHDATQAVARETGPRALVVSVAGTFASEWLVPRLAGFQSAHPDIDLRMSTARDVPDFATTDVELAIPYGRGGWPGLVAELLMPEDLVPLCSPKLLVGRRAVRKPEDLRHATLIHVLQRPDQWAGYLRVAGLTDIEAGRGPNFQSTFLALEAAMSGMGVALGNRILARPSLASGRLVIPFELKFASGAGYYLVHPPGADRESRVAAFKSWIEAALAAERGEGSDQAAASSG